ncbi:MAG: hypothetical protein PHF60_04575 [Candidatus ainarchaeum sp.]|nr:hypothetical protein [Candidatus ainarchaeum sp.]
MKKKIVKKKAKAPKEEIHPVPQTPIEFEEPEPRPAEPEAGTPPEPKNEEPKKGKGSGFKIFVVLLLFAVAVVLAYYFITASAFDTGPGVDAETFKNNFAAAETVYIVMDVRGVKDPTVSNNVLQCGVDFAASSGMGGKDAVYFSFGDDGCTAPDGPHPLQDCVSQLKNGLTIYVKEGPGGASYYSKAMVVTVGKTYTFGTCGIKWV